MNWNNIQAIGWVDVTQMQAFLVARHSKHFDDDTRRQDTPGSPYRRTKTIVLRGPQGIDDAAGDEAARLWSADVEHVNAPLLSEWATARKALMEIEKAIHATLGAPPVFGKILVESLEPGGVVDWHFERGDYADKHYRFHVGMIVCPGAVLYSGGEFATLQQGVVAFFNYRVLNSAINIGAIPRVHLIVDVRVPEKTN